MAWPVGYVPPKVDVSKYRQKKTKEEIEDAERRSKHHVKLAPLNKFFIDQAIKDLGNVASS